MGQVRRDVKLRVLFFVTVVTCVLELVSEMPEYSKPQICSVLLRGEELRLQHLVRVRWDVLRGQNEAEAAQGPVGSMARWSGTGYGIDVHVPQ